MTTSRARTRSSSLRRRLAAVALAGALPMTMAVSCGEEPAVGEQEEQEEQGGEQEDDEGDDD